MRNYKYIWFQSCKAVLVYVFIPYMPGSDLLIETLENNAVPVLQYEELNC